MGSLQPSFPVEKARLQIFNAHGGPQNVSSGSSRQYNSFTAEGATSHNYGGTTGNPTFNNFGTVSSSRTNFAGSYAYSSLRPVSTYVSRPELEAKLQAQFPSTEEFRTVSEMRTAVVWGLGGAGKSQLVLEYVQKQRRPYQAVFWIEAGRKESIQRDYLQIYRQLYCDTGRDAAPVSIEDAITGVKSWLQQQDRRCLWVMDSADDIEDHESGSFINLNYYLPEASRLDRILTTRSSRAKNLATQSAIAVSEMSPDEAAYLFQRSARMEQRGLEAQHEIQAIVEELGYLALAVTLAGSRIQSQSSEAIKPKSTPAGVHQYGESVLSTWEVSMGAVQQQSPVAANLMHLLAFLNSNDIFLSLFTVQPVPASAHETTEFPPQRIRLRDQIRRLVSKRQLSPPPPIHEIDVSSLDTWRHLLSSQMMVISYDDVVSAFKMLQAYSLVSWQADRESYSIHKLVHAWSHDRLELEQRQLWSIAMLGLLSGVLWQYQGQREIQIRLVPHLMANFTAIRSAHNSMNSIYDSDQARIYDVSKLLYHLGRWHDAYEMCLFVYRVRKKALGPEHHLTLTIMRNLAPLTRQMGKFEQAEEMYRQMLRLEKKIFGPEHSDTLSCMNDLAMILGDQGKYEQAEEIHSQVLRQQEELLGRQHPSTLYTIGGLALILGQQGKYKQAEEMLSETIRLEQKVLGPEHPDTLDSVSSLAVVLREQGKYEQAEQTYRQILQIYEEMYGQEHLSTLRSMHGLAIVLCQQGKYEQAEGMCEQTFRLLEEVLGRQHPRTLDCGNNLAKILMKLGKWDEAERTSKQTLRLYEEVLGRQHPDTLSCGNNLVKILKKQSKYDEAKRISELHERK